ncbi:hypothetical protein BGW41_005953 [Actinomortierella wolfii]|nr:hypothetical protein BGW41_005953 [Actinomortierella wolfii]
MAPQPTTRSQQQNTTARNAANDVPARLFATPVAPRSMRKDQASTRSHRSPLSRTPNNPITESTSRQQPQQHQQQQHDADNTEGGDVNEAPSTISSQHSSSLHPTSTKVIHATEEDGGVEIIRRVTRRETHEVVHVSTLRTTKPQSVGELKDTAHGTGEGKATSEQEEAAAGDEEEEDEPLVRYRPATHAAAAAVASADSTSHQTRSSPSKVPPEAVDEASPPAPTASGDTQMMEAEIQLSEMGILVDDDLEAHDRVIAESRNPHEEFYLKIEHGIESGSDDDDGIQAEKTPRTGTRPYGVHERLLDYLMYKYRNEIEALVKFELVTRYEALDILDACSGDIQLAKQYINGEVPDNKQGDIWTRDEDKVLMQMFEDDDQKELETLHSTVQCTKRSRYLTRTRMEAKLWKPKVHTRSLAADTVSRSAGANGKDVPSEHEG